jgi:hypothetical protein
MASESKATGAYVGPQLEAKATTVDKINLMHMH